MKSKSEKFHDSIVSRLENILTSRGFDCQTHIEYSEKDSVGEIDLFAIDDSFPPKYYFYEVKSHLSKDSLRCAKKQYKRYLRTYDLSRQDVQGFFYSSEGRRIPL
jgi:RecB family endonuclease NucS